MPVQKSRADPPSPSKPLSSLRENRGNSGGIPSSEEILDQVERLLQSDYFSHAVTLRRFLRFVTRKTIQGRCDEIKESVLGVEVFGRPSNFDGRIDNVVRVQAHRVRERLKNYYAGPGRNDPVLVKMPKGRYVPCFRIKNPAHSPAKRVSSRGVSPAALADAESPVRRTSSGRGFFVRDSRDLFIPSIILALAMGGLTGYILRGGGIVSQPSGRSAYVLAPVDPPLEAFWKHFWSAGAGPTVVAFTNPVFLMTEGGDLLRYVGPHAGPTRTRLPKTAQLEKYVNPRLLRVAGPLEYNQDFTAVGEVHAVQELTRLFLAAGAQLEVKSSRRLLVDDLKRHNVIYLGAPYGNDTLGELPVARPFIFSNGGIVNSQPREGEEAFYDTERETATGSRKGDYSLVSVLPGLGEGKKIVVFAGTSTKGTLGATLFAASSMGASDLIRYFGTPEKGLPSFFQVLLRSEIIKEDISRTTIVTGRILENDVFSSPSVGRE